MSLTMAEWRRIKKISQDEMAERLGISTMTVRSWEAHPEMIRLGYVPKIAEILGIDAKDIFLPDNRN